MLKRWAQFSLLFLFFLITTACSNNIEYEDINVTEIVVITEEYKVSGCGSEGSSESGGGLGITVDNSIIRKQAYGHEKGGTFVAGLNIGTYGNFEYLFTDTVTQVLEIAREKTTSINIVPYPDILSTWTVRWIFTFNHGILTFPGTGEKVNIRHASDIKVESELIPKNERCPTQTLGLTVTSTSTDIPSITPSLTNTFAPTQTPTLVPTNTSTATKTNTPLPIPTRTPVPEIWYISVQNNVNVRLCASTSCNIITTLSYGDEVNVISTENNWHTILINDDFGYVSANLTSPDRPTAPLQLPVTSQPQKDEEYDTTPTPIQIPSDNLNGKVYNCTTTGYHKITIVGGAYNPYGFSHESSPGKYRTSLHIYRGGSIQYSKTDNPQPIGGTILGHMEEVGPTYASAENKGKGDNKDVYCEAGEILRIVTVDTIDSYHIDNEGWVDITIQSP